MTASFYLVRETEKARLYRRMGERQNAPDIWIPRSAIIRQTKWGAEPGKLPLCEVTLEDWFAKKSAYSKRGQQNKSMRLFRWIFGGFEYGDSGEFIEGILYRRDRRSGAVAYKGKNGNWITIHSGHWFKFRPCVAEIREIKMPDGSFFQYTDKERDKMGEIAFEKKLADRRRLALEKKIFARKVIT